MPDRDVRVFGFSLSRKEREPFFHEDFRELVAMFVMAGPLLIAPSILGWQMFHWLQSAQWFPLPTSWVFDRLEIAYPHTSWAGVNVIIKYILDSPLSGVAFVAAILWLLVSMRCCIWMLRRG
jgi:hypothetical protein